ncbi:MAG: hypothetical protein K2N87_20670 [Eubacterium sp.]|nr:hypothetical protein [Eubacterium sp.]
MGKLIIDGNKVYTVDEACMKRKNLTLSQIRQRETGDLQGKALNRAQRTRTGDIK